jgi:hypothetical protein
MVDPVTMALAALAALAEVADIVVQLLPRRVLVHLVKAITQVYRLPLEVVTHTLKAVAVALVQ